MGNREGGDKGSQGDKPTTAGPKKNYKVLRGIQFTRAGCVFLRQNHFMS